MIRQFWLRRRWGNSTVLPAMCSPTQLRNAKPTPTLVAFGYQRELRCVPRKNGGGLGSRRCKRRAISHRLRPLLYPVIHRLVPELRILRLEHPVAFVGEVEHL